MSWLRNGRGSRWLGIVAPEGCGKTHLLNALSEEARKGSVCRVRLHSFEYLGNAFDGGGGAWLMAVLPQLDIMCIDDIDLPRGQQPRTLPDAVLRVPRIVFTTRSKEGCPEQVRGLISEEQGLWIQLPAPRLRARLSFALRICRLLGHEPKPPEMRAMVEASPNIRALLGHLLSAAKRQHSDLSLSEDDTAR